MATQLKQAALTIVSPPTMEDGLTLLVRDLEGRNLSPLTSQAYKADIAQFIAWLHETNVTVERVYDVERVDISEYLGCLADQGRSGVTRARKLAAVREFFRFCQDHNYLAISPAATVAIPKKEKRTRVYLRPEEYTKLLSAAGGHPRDFAILQLFLQTGIRVSELCNLTLAHLDLAARTITIESGKGKKGRTIDLEKKAMQAIKSYLSVRPQVLDDRVFLNYEGVGISVRGVKKLIEKYVRETGITKKVGCHSLRHTFATYKAERGISAFQLKEWLGHESIATTQIYVHMGRGENSRKAMEVTSL